MKFISKFGNRLFLNFFYVAFGKKNGGFDSFILLPHLTIEELVKEKAEATRFKFPYIKVNFFCDLLLVDSSGRSL